MAGGPAYQYQGLLEISAEQLRNLDGLISRMRIRNLRRLPKASLVGRGP